MSASLLALALVLAQTSAAPPSPTEKPIEIQAVDLWSACKDNPVAAELRFGKRRLRVLGQVADITKVSDKEYRVMLKVFYGAIRFESLQDTSDRLQVALNNPRPPQPPDPRAVYCFFSDPGPVRMLATGLNAIIEGEYGVFANERVTLRNCTKTEIPPAPPSDSALSTKPPVKKKSPAKPTPAVPKQPPMDSEQVAATRLKFARILLEDGKRNDAMFRLERLIKDLPQTKAAAEAQTLLGKLKR